MSVLKYLVLYSERNYANDDVRAQSIVDNLYVLDPVLAGRIASYMRHGKVLIEFVSPIPDPYSPSDLVRNVVFSDGVYAWDGIILNWVEKYRIRLPEEFIAQVEAAGENPETDTLNVARLLEDFKSAERIMIPPNPICNI